jgi:hypothetical protein
MPWHPRSDPDRAGIAASSDGRQQCLRLIEQAFAKLKALLRKIAARTVATLWDLGDLLDHFTPPECANYLASAGYVPLIRATL